MKKQAFAYLRVSSQGQINGDGFDRQMDAIKIYAEMHGYEIAGIFPEEGISGTADETKRPAFQAMISEILKNGTKTIILERLDRLAREYRIQESLAIYLASKGVSLISADTRENITLAIQDDPMKQALIQIQGIFAELEKGLLVKKLRAARERIREKGKKCEGRRSYAEAAPELVTEIKRLRRKPRGRGRRKSYKEVAQLLNTKGYLTLTGKPLTAQVIADIVRPKKR